MIKLELTELVNQNTDTKDNVGMDGWSRWRSRCGSLVIFGFVQFLLIKANDVDKLFTIYGTTLDVKHDSIHSILSLRVLYMLLILSMDITKMSVEHWRCPII